MLADHGAFNATAQPTKYPAGFFHIFTGSYDLEAAYCTVKGVYTNKAPGGVAYRCSFRVTEAAYLVERMVDLLADELGIDPVELRLQNFIRPEQFPYTTKTGWTYDSGEYAKTMREAMRIAGYDELRREQAEKRERGEYMGIGVSFFTETVGAGPRKDMDIAGLGMADGAELRVHPTGKAVLRISVQTQGQGHETTFAQIVAEELGIPPEDIEVVHGDTDQTPFGLGTYGSRSTPVSGAATAKVARKIRDKARLIAGAALEVSPDDLEWEKGRWFVKGDPEKGQTIQELALASHGTLTLPEGVEGHLDAVSVYDPPNLTYPYGAYICVVEVDPGTGEIKLERFISVDDCGVRINPMIVEGQIMGGLAEGLGIALMQHIAFDEQGNCLSGSFMDYLVPSSMECPDWELGETVTPVAAPPDRREGRRRVVQRRLAARDRQRGGRRARAVRRAPRRHAGDARPRVGGDAERARRSRRSEPRRRGAGRRRDPVRRGHGRALRLADQRAAGRPGDRARRRHDRRLRRRLVRRRDRAAAGAARAGDGRAGAAAHPARRRRTARATRRARSWWPTRA